MIMSTLRDLAKSKAFWISCLVFLAVGSIVWFLRHPRPQVSPQEIQDLQQQVQVVQEGFQELLAIPEQVRKEVGQGAREIVVRVESHTTDDRLRELDRIIELGKSVLAGGHEDPSD